MNLSGGNIMKLHKNVLKVWMFAAVLLGATITTQTAKADTTAEPQNEKQTVTNDGNVTGIESAQKSDATSETQSDSTTNSNNTVVNNDTSSTVDSDTNWSKTNIDNPGKDYFHYVNRKWLNVAKPATGQQMGALQTAQTQMDNKVHDKFMSYVNGTVPTNDPTMLKAIEFYRQAYNSDLSNDAAFNGINQDIKTVRGLNNITDLNDNLYNLMAQDISLPFGLKIDRDQNDSSLKTLYFYGATPLLLDDNGEFTDNMKTSQDTIGNYLASNAHWTFEEIQDLIINTKRFDKLLYQIQTANDRAENKLQDNYTGAGINQNGNYLPVVFSNFANISPYLDLDTLVDQLVGETPGYIYEMTPSFYNKFNRLFNADTFYMVRDWMVSKLVLNRSSYMKNLTEHDTYQNGHTKAETQSNLAYYVTSKAFAPEFSKYFGDILLSKLQASGVKQMIGNIMSSYEKEITDSTWLSDSAKDQALNKLSKMIVNVGYPSDSYDFYNDVTVDPTKSIYQNYLNLLTTEKLDRFQTYARPAVRGEWNDLSSLVTNAYYSPQDNAIYISTAFITSPFFDINQTDSQNYGALGTVIGHELSHAFDSNGSLFNGYGLFENWLTPEDLKALNQKMSTVASQYNGINYADKVISGAKVVDEALADNAGLQVSENALKATGHANIDQFFRSYATSNRVQMDKLLFDNNFAQDPHAPMPLRVNVNVSNMPDFYSTYDVQPGEGMYRDPNNRVQIWD
ncbi:M13 family metallopeptidase [Lactobacillus salsicarnum]|nr:M13 family metallopeptidase [Companilactobacillus mishanensis]